MTKGRPDGALEHTLFRAFGDWQSPENPLPDCPTCSAKHEEPVIILMILTGWSCDRIQIYRSRAMPKVLEGSTFNQKVNRYRYYFPYERYGAWLAYESDQEYMARLMSIRQSLKKTMSDRWKELFKKGAEKGSPLVIKHSSV